MVSVLIASVPNGMATKEPCLWSYQLMKVVKSIGLSLSIIAFFCFNLKEKRTYTQTGQK